MHGLLGDGLPRGGLLGRRGSQPRGYGATVARGNILPFARTAGGRTRLAVPGLLMEMWDNFQRANEYASGQVPMSEANVEDVTRSALDLAGTGYATGLLSGPKAAGLLSQNVWHGGPNKWKPEPGFPQGRPRLEFIGKGEGAKAYGWGFYSADAKAVGKGYKDDTGLSITIDGQPILVGGKQPKRLSARTSRQQDLEDNLLIHRGDVEAAIKELQTYMGSRDLSGKPHFRKHLDENMADLVAARGRNIEVKTTGSLYHLDLDDKDIAKYLDWDAPLSEQPEGVRAALMKLANDPPPEYDSFDHLAIAAMRGEHPRNKSYEPTGKEIYEDLASFNLRSSGYGSDHAKAASEALRKAGIPGLKYYDGLSRIGSPQSVANTRQKLMKAQERLSAWQNSDEAVAGQQLEMLQKEIARLEKYLGQQLAEPETRNYVTWDQDVLDRVKILERH